jgi:hypothetical protein
LRKTFCPSEKKRFENSPVGRNYFFTRKPSDKPLALNARICEKNFSPNRYAETFAVVFGWEKAFEPQQGEFFDKSFVNTTGGGHFALETP